jgi:hypothetical protein
MAHKPRTLADAMRVMRKRVAAEKLEYERWARKPLRDSRVGLPVPWWALMFLAVIASS